jgi:hypothetical protein
VLDSGVLKYRTGTQVLSDIGAGTSNFDGQYSSLTGAPTLAAVATSGSYTDLSNKPTIYAEPGIFSGGGTPTLATGVTGAEVRTLIGAGTSNFDGAYSSLTGAPTLATVATSGSYNDLSDQPTIPTVNNGTLTMTTSAGLNGTATFTANQSDNSAFTVSLDLSELTDMTEDVNGANDELILLDSSAERRKLISEIKLGQFNNDQGWTSNNGTVTGTGTVNYVSKWTSNSAQGDSTIYDDGDVGIGMTSPNAKLTVSRTDTTYAVNLSDTESRAGLSVKSSTSFDSKLTISSGASSRQYIQAVNNAATTGRDISINPYGGNVGIGATSPAYLLDVNENDNAIAFRVTGGGGGASMASFVRDVGATGSSVNINAQSNFPQIQFVNTGNTFSIGGDTSGNFKISDNTAIGTNDRITIDNTGNVGIGTTSPGEKLTISGGNLLVAGDYQSLYVGGKTDSSQDGIRMSIDNAGNGYFDHRGSGILNFRVDSATGATTRMVINSSGNVGVGTNDPNQKLTIKGTDQYVAAEQTSYVWGAASTVGVRMGTDATAGLLDFRRWVGASAIHGTALITQFNSDGGYGLDFRVDTQSSNTVATTSRMFLSQSGEVGIGNTTPAYKLDVSGTIRATGDVIAYSDIRVKENITTIEKALDKVKKLRGVEYNKIDNTEKSIGVIAQEIEEVIPEVVREDDQGMKSVAYGNITAVLIEAIKEQQKQIDELKNQLDAFTK